MKKIIVLLIFVFCMSLNLFSQETELTQVEFNYLWILKDILKCAKIENEELRLKAYDTLVRESFSVTNDIKVATPEMMQMLKGIESYELPQWLPHSNWGMAEFIDPVGN